MVFNTSFTRTHMFIMIYLSGFLLAVSTTSCKQTVPDKDIDYLSTISGQVLSNCPNQTKKLCAINIGNEQYIEIREDIPENTTSIALAPNGHIFAQSRTDPSLSTSTILIGDMEQVSEIQEFTQNGFVTDISWSTDGMYLAYEVFLPDSNSNHCNHYLFIQRFSNSSNSPKPFSRCVLDYAWSPFGNEMIYSSHSEENNNNGTYLYKLDVETEDTTVLQEAVDGLVHMSIQWSPNGQYISFVEGIGPMESTGDLVLIDTLSAKEPYRAIPQDCGWLSLNRLCYTWSPDSAKVAFIKSTDNISHFSLEDLYTLNVNDGEIEQVTHTEEYAIDDNFDGLGIRLSHPLWLTSSTITLFWTQDNHDYLVVTSTDGDISLITEYQSKPYFYQAIAVLND